ncbi:MAG: hypothetical protein PHQ43_01810 [Dehalococcoidales bacterium]|nr:hypothetical protein [Dehalococcoidales bacterium]
MRQDDFEDIMDSIIKVLAIVAAAGAIAWVIIPGIWLIIRGV